MSTLANWVNTSLNEKCKDDESRIPARMNAVRGRLFHNMK